MANELAPTRLRRLLAELTISQALIVDAIRGRSIRKADVSSLRAAVSGIHGVLRALDVTKPWDPPAPPGPNPAPRVDAGVDTIGSLTMVIAGTSDAPTIWTKVSGPGDVTFDDDSVLSPLVTFTEIGTYVLRLTADDGTTTAYDELTIEVS